MTFYPDRPGNWRIVALDGEGHAVRADITVAGDLITPGNASTGQEAKGLRRWLFVSMLASLGLIFLLLMGFDKRIAGWRATRENSWSARGAFQHHKSGCTCPVPGWCETAIACLLTEVEHSCHRLCVTNSPAMQALSARAAI